MFKLIVQLNKTNYMPFELDTKAECKAKLKLLAIQGFTWMDTTITDMRPMFTIETIATNNPDKFYLIKTYLKGGVQTVNQLIKGKVFYRRWERYNRASIAIIRGA